MALVREFMGLGVSGGLAQALRGATTTGISTAGSTITDATDLTTGKNVVSTATAGQGVQLFNMGAGESQIVYNATATPFTVYPGASTVAINQFAVGVGVLIGAYTVCEFHQVSATQVIANLSA